MARASSRTRAGGHVSYYSTRVTDPYGSTIMDGGRITRNRYGRTKKTPLPSVGLKEENKYYKEQATKALKIFKETGYEPKYIEYLSWMNLIKENEAFRRKVIASGNSRKKYHEKYGKNKDHDYYLAGYR